jgi:hypothetical protein
MKRREAGVENECTPIVKDQRPETRSNEEEDPPSKEHWNN